MSRGIIVNNDKLGTTNNMYHYHKFEALLHLIMVQNIR